MSDKSLSTERYDQLSVHPKLAEGIAEAGFEFLTPIQALTLPLTLEDKDVAGQAQTGTGKTAAYLIALINKLLKGPVAKPGQALSLILVPTRELAVQVHKDAVRLTQYTDLKLGLAFGGIDYDKQRATLEQGVDILIATPGRIIDYYKQGVIHFKQLQVLVLDEADRMFDLGFIKDIRYLLRRLPAHDKRLNLLFSATLGQRVLELSYEHMNDPVVLRVESEKITADKVTQSVYYPANEEKLQLLVALLKENQVSKAIIFCNTKRTCQRIQDTLIANDLEARTLSGDIPQNKRLSLMKRFEDGELSILVATDVASRGLHIPDVSHVFNYDLPEDAEDYVHRVGRTARAGAKGIAVSFACEDYAFSLPAIEKLIGFSLPLASIQDLKLEEIKIAPRRKPKPTHNKGRRPRNSSNRRR